LSGARVSCWHVTAVVLSVLLEFSTKLKSIYGVCNFVLCGSVFFLSCISPTFPLSSLDGDLLLLLYLDASSLYGNLFLLYLVFTSRGTFIVTIFYK
jgi:hypothetical protein